MGLRQMTELSAVARLRGVTGSPGLAGRLELGLATLRRGGGVLSGGLGALGVGGWTTPLFPRGATPAGADVPAVRRRGETERGAAGAGAGPRARARSCRS